MKRNLLAVITLVLALPGLAGAVVWTNPTMPATGPTNLSVPAQGVYNAGGGTWTGSFTQAAIGTPSAPTVTTNGTAGSTSLVYACTALDANGNATIPSGTTTITTANATLTTTNSVNITCGGQVGALAYLIHKVDTSHVLASCYTNSNNSCTVIDNGSVATTFTYTPNTVDATALISGASNGVLAGSTNAVVSTSVETFFPVYGSGTGDVAATVGDATVQNNRPATIRNLHCGTYTILGAAVAAGGTNIVFALGTGAPGVAPTDSTLTCTETTAQTTCSDTTHVISLAALSNMYFSGTPTGTPTASVLKCSADISQ